MLTFAPNKQDDYVRLGTDRMFMGTAPTLIVLEAAYGIKSAEGWTEIQIRDLSEFAGCRDKLDIKQIANVAKVIHTHYGHLKVTELMLFFSLFKAGKYGSFYGSVDNLRITEALNRFMDFRFKEINRLREQQIEAEQARRDAESRANAITYKEHLRRQALERDAASRQAETPDDT